VGEVARLDEGARETAASSACSPRSKRQAFFGGWREVPVYALDDLRPGHTLTGPAIIEAETTTVLVDSGDRVMVNALGWLDIELR
jgi:N-methylhydantoinase A